MEIKKYLKILNRRKWVIIITVLVTLLVVIIASWRISPTYSATTTLRIATASASSSSYADYMFADRLITTYINLATSRPLLDELDKQLGISMTPVINVKQIPNSELIQITVEDHDPNLAMKAANTLGSILVEQGGDFYTGGGKTPADVLKEQVDKAEKDLNQLRNDYFDRLARYPDDTEGNQTASNAVDMQQQLYFSLLSQYQALSIREAIQSNIVSFVETANLPTSPSKPNKVLNIALGLVVSLIGGLGLALLFDNFDSTLNSAEEIRNISPLRPIGHIPVITKREHRIPPLDGVSILSEAISNLKTNLLSLIEDSPMRTFMVASSMQGEGKTMIASNLAFSLAQSGKNVILVDCDLRVPSVHRIFNLTGEVGLSDFLMEEVTLEKIINRTSSDNLHVITGGQATNRPALLLDSSRMKAMFSNLSLMFDIILLDSPAVLAVTDASVLAGLVDGIILVTRLGVNRKEKLIATFEQLENVKAKLIGMVINGDESSNYYTYYNRRAANSRSKNKWNENLK